MDPEQQRQGQSNHVKDCIWAPIKCIGILLICPFTLVFGFIFGIIFIIFFSGPLIYYRGSLLNSDALAQKYKNEGVRLQGKVIARWKTGEISDAGPMFHVRVVYRVDQDRYVNNDMVVNQDLYSKQKLDLIRLPGYCKSAIIFVGLEGVDSDFPPSKLPSVFFAFFWMTMW